VGLARRNKDRIKIMDALKAPEEIHKQIVGEIKKLLEW
jgi:hypothetical protein